MGIDAIGIFRLYWKGKYYDTEKGATFKKAGTANEDVVGGLRAFRSQKFSVGEVKATVVLTNDMTLDEFDPADGGQELQVQAVGGKSWAMPEAWITDQKENSDKGTASVTWHFNSQKTV